MLNSSQFGEHRFCDQIFPKSWNGKRNGKNKSQNRIHISMLKIAVNGDYQILSLNLLKKKKKKKK